MRIGENTDVFIVYVDGMADRTTINDYILRPLMTMDHFKNSEDEYSIDYILENILSVNSITKATNYDEIISQVLDGLTALFIEDCDVCLLIESRGFEKRSVDQPVTGDGGTKDGYTYITVDAPSFFTGINILNSSVPRRLVFTHTGIIVISEELAREGIIGEYIAPIIRYRQVRGTTHMIVTKGSALDFIKSNEPFIGTTLSKALQTAAQESTNTGFFGHTTLNDFYNDLKSTYAQPVVTMGAVNEFKNFEKKGPKWGNEFKSCSLGCPPSPKTQDKD